MNVLAKSVTIELGELGERTLRLTMLEAQRFREASGKSFVRDGVNLIDMDEAVFVQLVHSCIQERDGLSYEAVAANLHGGNFIAVWQAVESLVAEYFGPLGVAQKNPPRRRAKAV